MKARERGFTILLEVANSLGPVLFQDVKLPFDLAKHAEMEGRRQLTFFQALFKTLKKKESLEDTSSDDFDWNTMFNYPVGMLDEEDHENGSAKC